MFANVLQNKYRLIPYIDALIIRFHKIRRKTTEFVHVRNI